MIGTHFIRKNNTILMDGWMDKQLFDICSTTLCSSSSKTKVNVTQIGTPGTNRVICCRG